jgi:hypothetical protein
VEAVDRISAYRTLEHESNNYQTPRLYNLVHKDHFTWWPCIVRGNANIQARQPFCTSFIPFLIPNIHAYGSTAVRISGRKSDKTVGEAQSQLISTYGCDGSRINFVHYSRHVGQESGSTLLAVIISNLLIQLTRPLQRLFLSACSMSQGLILVCLKA